jgi:hypothetical protein
MPVFAKEVLDVGAEQVGFLLGASGVGAIAGTWFIASLKRGQPKGMMILSGAMFYGATQTCFALAAW